MILVLFLAAFLVPPDAHAGAAVARQQQMKAMRQQAQQEQDQMIQQAIQQRQQEEVQAYQQAVAQQQAAQIQAAQVQAAQFQAAQAQAVRQMIMEQVVQREIEVQIAAAIQQAQIEAVQAAMVKKAVEQEIVQQLVQQAAKGYAVQVQQQMIAQAVAQQVQRARNMRDVAAVKAVVHARDQQAAQQYAAAASYQQAAAYQQAQVMQSGVQQGQIEAMGRPYEQVSPDQVKDVVDISQVWQRLDKDSRAWALLIDNQAKVATVQEYMDRLRKEGAGIHKSTAEYAFLIDQAASQNSQMLAQPFKDLLRLVAIMEYDLDNGMGRDELARKVLGEKLYKANKQRLRR